jgi:hypothetical protein
LWFVLTHCCAQDKLPRNSCMHAVKSAKVKYQGSSA